MTEKPIERNILWHDTRHPSVSARNWSRALLWDYDIMSCAADGAYRRHVKPAGDSEVRAGAATVRPCEKRRSRRGPPCRTTTPRALVRRIGVREVGVAGGDVLGVRGRGLAVTEISVPALGFEHEIFFPLASSRSRKQEKPFLRSNEFNGPSRRVALSGMPRSNPANGATAAPRGGQDRDRRLAVVPTVLRSVGCQVFASAFISHARPLETAQQHERE